MSAHSVKINSKITERVKGLYLEHLEVPDVVVNRTPEALIEAKKSFLDTWKEKTINDLESSPIFKAYREIHTQFDAYPSDIPLAVENLYVRGILQGKFPTISNVVDACNLVSVKTLIPIGVFDSDRIVGNVTLRLAEEGDEFIPIGKNKPMKIEANIPILEDEERIISCIGVRDSDETKITKHTRNLLIFSWGNDDVLRDFVKDALAEAASTLRLY